MGAQTFMEHGHGTDVKDAFSNAVDQACYDYGHAGYTGSLAEKDSYVVIPLEGEATREAAVRLANQLMDDDDVRISDKWGPAGAIRYFDESRPEEQSWVFFGWASS